MNLQLENCRIYFMLMKLYPSVQILIDKKYLYIQNSIKHKLTENCLLIRFIFINYIFIVY
jgi:hypothetical protein